MAARLTGRHYDPGMRDTVDALAHGVHVLLERRRETLATAESLTGGLLAEILTAAPGASTSYVGGVVAYATSLKTGLLGVPADVVERHGVVSEQCARAMAEGVRTVAGATYALATTGVAGPEPQEDKPVGTVHVAVATPDGTVHEELALDGDRSAIRMASCAAVLSALATILDAEA